MLSRQLSGEIAKKMYMENERPPDMPKIPDSPRRPGNRSCTTSRTTPSRVGAKLGVVGRSKQSPHKSAEVSKEQEVKATPVQRRAGSLVGTMVRSRDLSA